jgi:hypothetical protein
MARKSAEADDDNDAIASFHRTVEHIELAVVLAAHRRRRVSRRNRGFNHAPKALAKETLTMC